LCTEGKTINLDSSPVQFVSQLTMSVPVVYMVLSRAFDPVIASFPTGAGRIVFCM